MTSTVPAGSKIDRQEFDAALEQMSPGTVWARVYIPFSVEEVFGSRSRVAVQGTLNGVHFRSSLFPEGTGRHYLYVNKGLCDSARVGPGDLVHIVLERDDVPREYAIPPDLLAALQANPIAEARFDKMSPAQKQAYLEWIEAAKRPETRLSRIEKAILLIGAGKRLK